MFGAASVFNNPLGTETAFRMVLMELGFRLCRFNRIDICNRIVNAYTQYIRIANADGQGNPAFEAATKNTVEAVKKTGVEVEEATPEMVQAVNELAEMQKKSLETALPEDESSFKGTVVSSDDGTKVLKDIDNAIAKYENKGNSTKTFLVILHEF